MKKQSLYARKQALRQRAAEHIAAQRAEQQRIADQAAAEDALRAQILADIQSLALNASIHAWNGEDAQPMINKVGRLLYVVAFAADQAGVDAEHPDMRILRGTAGALESFAADQKHVDRYRASLQSGLAAINRLLPRCNDMHLLLGAAALEGKLDLMAGKTTAQAREAMGFAA